MKKISFYHLSLSSSWLHDVMMIILCQGISPKFNTLLLISQLTFISSIYKVHTISFQTFFIWAFKIVVDALKFSMLLLYIL